MSFTFFLLLLILDNEAESAINIDSHRPLFNVEADTYEEAELPSSSSTVTKPNNRNSDSRSVVKNRLNFDSILES